MDRIIIKTFCRTPLVNQVRNKWHSKNPRLKHMPRRIMESVTVPVRMEDLVRKPGRICTVWQNIEDEDSKNCVKVNKYQEFLVREIKKMLDNNLMIVVCDIDSVIMRRRYELRNMLLDVQTSMVQVPDVVFTEALNSSKYANLSILIGSNTAILLNEQDKAKELMKVLKKIPELHVLGCAIGDYNMTKQGLEEYSRLPNIDNLRGQLLSLSKSPMSRTLSLLQHHQRMLISRLDRIGVNDGEVGETKEEVE